MSASDGVVRAGRPWRVHRLLVLFVLAVLVVPGAVVGRAATRGDTAASSAVAAGPAGRHSGGPGGASSGEEAGRDGRGLPAAVGAGGNGALDGEPHAAGMDTAETIAPAVQDRGDVPGMGRETGTDRGTGADLSGDGVVLMRDEAGLFDASLHEQIVLHQLRLKRKTGVELYLVTKMVPSLDDVDMIGYGLFRSLVDEAGHYKVILVLIAIDGKKGKGVVNTNLGAGVYHLVDRRECEGLFVHEGKPFSLEAVKQGISYLCNRIEERCDERRKADLVTGNVSASTNEGRGGLFFVLAAGGLLSFLLFLAWLFAGARSTCPRCGAELKTRVNIVVGTGGADLARKTYKCFNCGYARRRVLFPTGLGRKSRR